MKKHFTLITFLMLGWGHVNAQCKIELNQYDLIFKEEFTGNRDSLINNPVWKFTPTDNLILNKNEIQRYQDSAIDVKNGNLIIRAIPLRDPYFYTYKDDKDISQTAILRYSSGYLDFKRDYCKEPIKCNFANSPIPYANGFAYGVFEMRCKLPKGVGAFPAFWLYSGATEIDIFEAGGRISELSNNVINHEYNKEPTPSATKKACQVLYNKVNLLEDLTNSFHTYTMVWTPEKVSFFFDGKELRTVYQTEVKTHYTPAKIVANLAITDDVNDGTWDNSQYTDIDGSIKYGPHTEMIVDYIRVYKPKPGYDYSHYKSDNAFKVIQLDEIAYNDRLVASNSGSISSSDNTNGVYYSGDDGRMHYYDANGKNYNHQVPTVSWQNSMAIKGDVVAGDNGFVAYKGVDDRVQYYNKDSNGNWFHGWADDGWVRGDLTSRVSDQLGALAVVHGVSNTLIFYRGLDNRMHKLEYNSSVNRWNHVLLPLDSYSPLASKVGGDVVALNGQIFYIGSNRVQTYWSSNGNYMHAFLDKGFPSETEASSQYGSLTASATGVFYRGKIDQTIHKFYYLNDDPNKGWNHQIILSSPMYPKVSGKIVESGNGLIYRGEDNKLHGLYQNNGQWVHDWLSSWGWMSPEIVVNGDNFTTSGDNKPIFFKNINNAVSKNEWCACERRDVTCDNTEVVYRQSNNSSVMVEDRIKKVDDNIFNIFPNPCDAAADVTTPIGVECLLILYDTQGKEALSSKASISGKTLLNTSTLSEGLYMLRIVSNKKSNFFKIVVKH